MSDRLTTDEAAPWTDTTRAVRRGDAHQHIAALKHGDGGDIVMFGSITLWNDLLTHGLVDELHLMLGKGVLGAGIPAFSSAPDTSLRPREVRQLEGSDNVVVRYAVDKNREHGSVEQLEA